MGRSTSTMDLAPRTPSHPGGRPSAGERAGNGGWEPPAFRVVALDCEITAYAPDDEPLF